MRALLLASLAACGSSSPTSSIDASATDGTSPIDGMSTTDGTPTTDGPTQAKHRTVIVVPFENKDTVEIYGDTTDAPYLNGLMATSAYATNFKDELALNIPSEPHYVWMEGGTNAFSDHTFTTDSDPSTTNTTASTDHLVDKLEAAGVTWMSFQEGITAGACPTKTSGEYAPKHDPFVFFSDVTSTARCAQHHAPIAPLPAELPQYTFITPNLCNDMHGDLLCPSGLSDKPNVKAGDTWAQANLPALIAYTHTHDAVLFLVWDEGSSTGLIPFIAIGDHVKVGADATQYNHSSLVKTIAELLGVPPLDTVASAPDFANMFEPGYL